MIQVKCFKLNRWTFPYTATGSVVKTKVCFVFSQQIDISWNIFKTTALPIIMNYPFCGLNCHNKIIRGGGVKGSNLGRIKWWWRKLSDISYNGYYKVDISNIFALLRYPRNFIVKLKFEFSMGLSRGGQRESVGGNFSDRKQIPKIDFSQKK